MSMEAIQADSPVVPVAEAPALIERVEKLERENRQLRREALLLAGIVTIGAGILASMLVTNGLENQAAQQRLAYHPRRLTAEAFVLTDAHGQPRAELKFVPIPEPAPAKNGRP